MLASRERKSAGAILSMQIDCGRELVLIYKWCAEIREKEEEVEERRIKRQETGGDKGKVEGEEVKQKLAGEEEEEESME